MDASIRGSHALNGMIEAARAAAYAGEPEQGCRLILLSPNSSRGVEVAKAFDAQIPVVHRTSIEIVPNVLESRAVIQTG